MAKVFLIIERKTDYTGCYYETDSPSVSTEVFDIVFDKIHIDSRIEKQQKIREKEREK